MEGDSHPEMSTPSPEFTVADVIVVVAYFALNLAVGIWVSGPLLEAAGGQITCCFT